MAERLPIYGEHDVAQRDEWPAPAVNAKVTLGDDDAYEAWEECLDLPEEELLLSWETEPRIPKGIIGGGRWTKGGAHDGPRQKPLGPRSSHLAHVIAGRAFEGVSVRLNGHEPKHGFMVALNVDGNEPCVGTPTPEMVSRFIRDHQQLLARPNMYLGAWYDTEGGELYLDCSMNVDDPEGARELGRQEKQLAIWDVDHHAEVRLSAESPVVMAWLPKDPAGAWAAVQGLLGELPAGTQT